MSYTSYLDKFKKLSHSIEILENKRKPLELEVIKRQKGQDDFVVGYNLLTPEEKRFVWSYCSNTLTIPSIQRKEKPNYGPYIGAGIALFLVPIGMFVLRLYVDLVNITHDGIIDLFLRYEEFNFYVNILLIFFSFLIPTAVFLLIGLFIFYILENIGNSRNRYTNNMLKSIRENNGVLIDSEYAGIPNYNLIECIEYLNTKIIEEETQLKEIKKYIDVGYDDIFRIINTKFDNPYFYEQQIGKVFDHLGFKVYVTKSSGDKGIDIELSEKDDYPGKVIVQCKNYEGNVSPSHIRDLIGTVVLSKANFGILATTGSVSRQTEITAQEGGVLILTQKKFLLFVEFILSYRNGMGGISMNNDFFALTSRKCFDEFLERSKYKR